MKVFVREMDVILAVANSREDVKLSCLNELT